MVKVYYTVVSDTTSIKFIPHLLVLKVLDEYNLQEAQFHRHHRRRRLQRSQCQMMIRVHGLLKKILGQLSLMQVLHQSQL